MLLEDIETEHLRVDYRDAVYLVHEDGDDEFLGYIDMDPAWPEHRLGPEPTWYLTELAEALDEWEDAHRGDYRPDANRAYNDGIRGVAT